VTLAALGYPVSALWFISSQRLEIIWLSNLLIMSVLDDG
jgi:hypothetical protein